MKARPRERWPLESPSFPRAVGRLDSTHWGHTSCFPDSHRLCCGHPRVLTEPKDLLTFSQRSPLPCAIPMLAEVGIGLEAISSSGFEKDGVTIRPGLQLGALRMPKLQEKPLTKPG